MRRYRLLPFMIGALLGSCTSELPAPPLESSMIDAQSLQPDEMHCQTVARERADDALANGYGFGIEESVYRETYDDCLTWRRRVRLE